MAVLLSILLWHTKIGSDLHSAQRGALRGTVGAKSLPETKLNTEDLQHWNATAIKVFTPVLAVGSQTLHNIFYADTELLSKQVHQVHSVI